MSRPSIYARRIIGETTQRIGESSRSARVPFAAFHSYPIPTSSIPLPPSRAPPRQRTVPPSSYRSYATSLASSSSPSSLPILNTPPKVNVIPPSIERIKEDGFFEDDIQLIPENQAIIHISPEAVTVSCRETEDCQSIRKADPIAISPNYIKRTPGCAR